MKYKVLTPQADNLMESTRSIGYSLQSAIADIVDNSIVAKAKNVYIQFPRCNHEYLSILDDGMGMTFDELLVAMMYGSKPISLAREDSDLGRFGLGLKMASLSQCRSLTVISKKNGNYSCATWDLDFIKYNKNWTIQLPSLEEIGQFCEIENLQKLESGTLVLWEKLDLMLQGINDVDSDVLKKNFVDVENHLSLVFHRYLNYFEKIEDNCIDKRRFSLNIECNGVRLTGIDPFISEQSSLAFSPEQLPNTNEISITPWVLPFPNKIPQKVLKEIGDLQQNQGFYIYRNKRLVIKGSWFYLNRKAELSKLIRVQVDIPNSSIIDREWKLDIKKSSATLPESLKKYLKKTVENLTVRSKRTFTKRAKIENLQDGIWKRIETEEGKVSYEVNLDNEYVRMIVGKYPEIKLLLKLISTSLPDNSIYNDRTENIVINSDKEVELDEYEEYLKYLPKDLADKIRGIKHGS